MTRPIYMPIRKVGLRVENGAGWMTLCLRCTEPTILIDGSVRVRVPYVCATCEPGRVIEPPAPSHEHACAQLARCEREAEQAERSARESRRFAERHRRNGLPGLAIRCEAAAIRAEAYAATLRVQAAAWRKVTGEEGAAE